MKTLLLKFWSDHGERLIFMFLALCFSIAMYLIGWTDEAKVIVIGLAMLCYNRARSPFDKNTVIEREGNVSIKKE